MSLIRQPGMLGPLKLKNRITLAPLGTNFSTSDGLITDRDKAYYAERAKGGVSMIMTSAMGVNGRARSHRFTPVCYHDRFIPGLASLVDTIKSHDCHVFGQLNHHGALLHEPGTVAVGPSDWVSPKTGDDVRPMTRDEIVDVQKDFASAARRLWVAGYDGVEIHAANGYLFQQFFTPRINHRTDEYGGSVENRMRFLVETVKRMQDAAPDLLLMVRFSVTEFTPDGYTQDDAIALARGLEQAGVVALDLSGGSNETPQLSKYCIQTPSFPRGCLAPLAKPIRDAVSIPVFVAGRIVEPQDAEAVLASGSADFISLGRALYADPHWCLKAFGEVDAPIRQCIACNVCHDRLSAERDVTCVQNPLMGTAFETLPLAEPQLQPEQARAERRRVLVLGAGVSGVEAARVAAARGHQVEVWERSDRIGGQVALAIAAPDKNEVEAAWRYPLQQAEALGVPMKTGIVADAAAIRAFAPDVIVLATGAVPRPIPFDCAALDASITVLDAWDVLRKPDRVPPGTSVTIVGGGTVGMETADLLAARGVSVSLIEPKAVLGEGMSKSNRTEVADRLRAAGVIVRLKTQIVSAEGSALELRGPDGTVARYGIGEMLLVAVGAQPNLDMVPVLEEVGLPYVAIGDCSVPGDFMTCLRDARMVGFAIDRYAARPVKVTPGSARLS
jgi:2,4-dienoyl-CoA reductase-like NADH-dependent reductase (Old Yellow Enzyme family)/NADPH-dependent 2,4-dienoyl-CoA reductase/sulfur reductase-like enzyme